MNNVYVHHRDVKTRNVSNEKPSLMNPQHWEMSSAASYTKVIGEHGLSIDLGTLNLP